MLPILHHRLPHLQQIALVEASLEFDALWLILYCGFLSVMMRSLIMLVLLEVAAGWHEEVCFSLGIIRS